MIRALAFGTQVFHVSAASMFALMAILLATPDARAQQTFVCEDGGSVTVLPGQLELMKRTDPCVARHFQDALEPAAPGSEWEAATAPPPGSAPMEAPLPEKKPETLMADAGSGAPGPAAAPQEPVKSDYRHVHIINAGSGAPKFFEHTR